MLGFCVRPQLLDILEYSALMTIWAREWAGEVGFNFALCPQGIYPPGLDVDIVGAHSDPNSGVTRSVVGLASELAEV
jgi:hypothetical protein